jgi:hypothetical protein
VDPYARIGVPPRPDLEGGRFPPPPGPSFPSGDVPESPRRRSVLPGAVALLLVVALLAAAVAPIFRSTVIAPQAVGPQGDFSYILTTGDDPVRWNPCEPIHYVLARDGLTPGALDDVRGAIARISDATGISFTYDGLTDEQPSRARNAYQPGRYGDRWAPVLIAWVHPDETDIPFSDEGHDAAAVASPQLPEAAAADVFVSGWVAVDVEDPNPSGFALPGMQGPVVLHELAHVLGLAHAESAGNLMEPSGGGMTSFGPGDIAGLEHLGRDAGCLPTPPPGPGRSLP